MDEYRELAQYILPEVIYKSFELTKVDKPVKDAREDYEILHLYLDERQEAPENRKDLHPNGFYGEMVFGDFPLRDRKVILHVRRRRWIDDTGKTVCNDWNLVQEGTRLSPELAAFF